MAERLTGGVSSDIWRVAAGGRVFCVKRAMAKLAVKDDWYAPVERNRYERLWYETAARPGSRDRAAGPRPRRCGDALRHGVSRSGRASPVESRTARWTRRPRLRRHGWQQLAARPCRHRRRRRGRRAVRHRPDLPRHPPRALSRGDRQAASRRSRRGSTRLPTHGGDAAALVHGDVSPKNILVGPAGPVFLDAECAWYGDPAFDLAFCLNHLLLKCLPCRQPRRISSRPSTRSPPPISPASTWEPRRRSRRAPPPCCPACSWPASTASRRSSTSPRSATGARYGASPCRSSPRRRRRLPRSAPPGAGSSALMTTTSIANVRRPPRLGFARPPDGRGRGAARRRRDRPGDRSCRRLDRVGRGRRPARRRRRASAATTSARRRRRHRRDRRRAQRPRCARPSSGRRRADRARRHAEQVAPRRQCASSPFRWPSPMPPPRRAACRSGAHLAASRAAATAAAGDPALRRRRPRRRAASTSRISWSSRSARGPSPRPSNDRRGLPRRRPPPGRQGQAAGRRRRGRLLAGLRQQRGGAGAAVAAIERAGFAPGDDMAISLDVAASDFGKAGRYRLARDGPRTRHATA